MTKTFYLVRHPDTGIDANSQKPGDPPAYNETVRLTKLANKLKLLNIDGFLTSDFERARQAAEYITSLISSLDRLMVTDVLREVLIWPDISDLGYRDSEEERERVISVLHKTQDECVTKLEQVVTMTDATKVCLFTHGNVIRCLVSAFGNHPLVQMMHLPIDHLSITEIHYDTETSLFTLKKVNDTLVQE